MSKEAIQESEYFFPYHYIDLVYDEFCWFSSIEYKSYMKLVKSRLGKKGFLLDAGCGDGRFLYEMQNSGLNLTGIDFSGRAIEFAKLFNPNAAFYVGDVRKTKFRQKFDFITLIEVYEHIPPKDTKSVLSALSGCLAENGTFVLTVPSVNQPLVRKHYRHFTKQILEKELGEFFQVKEIIGHSVPGIKRKLLYAFAKPFRALYAVKKFKFLDKSFLWIAGLFEKHLAPATPETGRRLIAVCSKKR